jgi:hypothetical protein
LPCFGKNQIPQNPDKMQEKKEAEIFLKYFLGSHGNQFVSVYLNMANPFFRADPVSSFAVKYPFFISVLDAGTGLFRKDCLFRKKLHLAFAISECVCPDREKFLPLIKPGPGIPGIVFHSVLSFLKAIPGGILLLFL